MQSQAAEWRSTCTRPIAVQATVGECLDVAQRQLRLMESQLQRFLRIGNRPTEIVKRDVDLGDLVEELLPLVRPAAQHAGVALDCRISSAASFRQRR